MPHKIDCSQLINGGAASILLGQPMDEIRVPLIINGGDKNLLSITHTAEIGGIPYFSIATGMITPKTIAVEFKNMTIRDANAGNAGKGGAINNAAVLTLTHVNLTNNKANEGGAIYNATTGDLTLRNCLLDNNEAIGAGREGGAIRATGNSKTPIRDSVLSNNKATGNKGGAISMNVQAQVQLFNTDLMTNTAAEGGAVYSSVGNAAAIPFTMTGGNVAGNTSTTWGGALFLSTTNARIDGTTFVGNSSAIGGAIYAKTNDLQLLNCTFACNSADLGPVVAYSGVLGQSVWITLTNTNITADDLIKDPNT